MTSKRDVQRLVKPLLADDPDLFAFDRYLAIRPARHVIVTLAFGYTLTPEYFRVEMCPTFLAELRPGQYPHVPEQKFFWPKDRFWDVREPEYPYNRRMALKYSLIPEMKMLNSMESFREIFSQYAHENVAGHWEVQTLLSIAHGKWAEAADWLPKDPFRIVLRLINDYSPDLGDRLLEQGDNLSTEDKRALIEMLHRRERDAIVALKLEKHWEPTPFPAEEKELV